MRARPSRFGSVRQRGAAARSSADPPLGAGPQPGDVVGVRRRHQRRAADAQRHPAPTSPGRTAPSTAVISGASERAGERAQRDDRVSATPPARRAGPRSATVHGAVASIAAGEGRHAAPSAEADEDRADVAGDRGDARRRRRPSRATRPGPRRTASAPPGPPATPLPRSSRKVATAPARPTVRSAFVAPVRPRAVLPQVDAARQAADRAARTAARPMQIADDDEDRRPGQAGHRRCPRSSRQASAGERRGRRARARRRPSADPARPPTPSARRSAANGIPLGQAREKAISPTPAAPPSAQYRNRRERPPGGVARSRGACAP